MALGQYKLVKMNSESSFDEKTVQAQSGNVLGFDNDLNPKTYSLVSMAESLRTNINITGGGIITFDGGGNLKWSQRFIVISNGRGTHFSTNGYFNIECPTSGIITGVGGASNVTATSNGIPIGSWQALYYILPIGGSSTSIAENFRIAYYSSELEIPDNWILIAVNNGEQRRIHLPAGYSLKLNESINTATYDAYNADKLDGYHASDFAFNSDLTNQESDLKLWVASRGQNLVSNGNGLMGDNTNFSAFSFTKAEAYNSPGSFHKTGNYSIIFSDEYIPVNANEKYICKFSAKSKYGTGNMYYFLSFYDVDNKLITAEHHMYFANTLTTLAADLNNGDTVVYLTNAANYKNNAGTNTHYRKFIFWDYVNSGGYAYPELTYSRHISPYNTWADGAVNYANNTITLNAPWTGGTVPSGTKVSNGSSGGYYKYIAIFTKPFATSWTNYEGYYQGIDFTGTNAANKFPPGTAKAKIGFLWNYNNAANEEGWVTNFYVGVADYWQAKDGGGIETIGNDSVNIKYRLGINAPTPRYRIDVLGTTSSDIINSDLGFNYNTVAAPSTLTGYRSSGGSLSAGTYNYYVTFVTAIGETTAKRLELTGVLNGDKVTLTIPTSSDYRVTARKLYRTKANTIYYTDYLLATVNDNTATEYIDTLADTSLSGTTGLASLRGNTTTKGITLNNTTVFNVETQNIRVGYNAGGSNFNGTGNTLLTTGGALTTGNYNTILGLSSGTHISAGRNNTLIGYYCGGALTTEWDNTLIGGNVLSQGKGNYNIAIGRLAGYSETGVNGAMTAVNDCIFIGWGAGSRYISPTQKIDPTNQILIGKGVSSTEDNVVVLGNDSIKETYLKGKVNADILSIKQDNCYLHALENRDYYSLNINPDNDFSNVKIGSDSYPSDLEVTGKLLLEGFGISNNIYSDSNGVLHIGYSIGSTQIDGIKIRRDDNVVQIGSSNQLYDLEVKGNLSLNRGTDTSVKISLIDDDTEQAYISQDFDVNINDSRLKIYSQSGIKIGDTGKSLQLNQFTLPTNDGISGYVLATNGAGQLSFIAPPTGTANNAAGNAKEIQFRGASSGEFAASEDFTWDNSTKLLDVQGNIELPSTSYNYGNPLGIIYKNGSPFIHNHSTNTASPYSSNTFVGIDSGVQYNSSNGTRFSESGYQTLEGRDNTGVGYVSLFFNKTGSYNTAVGSASLVGNSYGNNNTSVGYASLNQNISGGGNVSIGAYSSFNNQTGSFNVLIGTRAGFLLNGSNNLMLGGSSGEHISRGSNLFAGTMSAYYLGSKFSATLAYSGAKLVIETTGTLNPTDFTLIGAPNNDTGTEFIATGPATGDGQVSYQTTGNIIIGNNAVNNSTNLGARKCIVIGDNSDFYDKDTENSVLIGSDTWDMGSNTVSIGNSAITDNYFNGKLHTTESISIGNDTSTATFDNVGSIRYRTSGNNSYCEMVMQTGASTYAWVIIKQNTW